MLKNFVKIFGGDPNKKTIEQYPRYCQGRSTSWSLNLRR